MLSEIVCSSLTSKHFLHWSGQLSSNQQMNQWTATLSTKLCLQTINIKGEPLWNGKNNAPAAASLMAGGEAGEGWSSVPARQFVQRLWRREQRNACWGLLMVLAKGIVDPLWFQQNCPIMLMAAWCKLWCIRPVQPNSGIKSALLSPWYVCDCSLSCCSWWVSWG